MIRVLAVSHSYIVEENRKNLAALAKNVEVRAVVPHFTPDSVFRRIEADATDPGVLVFQRVSLPRSQYFLLTLDMGMKQFRPDVIHIEYDPWSIIFWQMSLCRRLYARNARIVCTVKKNTYRRLPWLLAAVKKTIARFFMRNVSKFIAVSQRVREVYQNEFGVPTSRIEVLQHLGVDVSVFCPRDDSPDRSQDSPKRPFVVGYCGRFDVNKGIMDLIEAIRKLNRSGPQQFQLKLLGRGTLLHELQQIREFWIELLPPVPHAEVAPFMRSLDAFVMPSLITEDHEEHDGHALMEALCCGVPCVGSTSGVIPELLSDDRGLVFNSGETDELAKCLAHLASDHSLSRHRNHRTRKSIHNLFSVDGIADQKAKLYRTFFE